jgi:hypothetical protein
MIYARSLRKKSTQEIERPIGLRTLRGVMIVILDKKNKRWTSESHC